MQLPVEQGPPPQQEPLGQVETGQPDSAPKAVAVRLLVEPELGFVVVAAVVVGAAVDRLGIVVAAEASLPQYLQVGRRMVQ